VSEQGWIDFLHAEGVDDWVVLHGGATAVFRVGSLGEAADLVAAIAAKPDDVDVGFWRAVLGYDPRADDNAVDPLGHGSTV
jgi:hypothetical protein